MYLVVHARTELFFIGAFLYFLFLIREYLRFFVDVKGKRYVKLFAKNRSIIDHIRV